MAETPSPALIGVQRVVIACNADSTLSEAERRALCEQLVKKAGTVTDLPVRLASAADLDPTNLVGQAEQLLLRVTATGVRVVPGRKTVALTVAPVRAAVNMAPLAPIKSSVSLLKVQDDWVVQGPVDAFTKLLGSGPRKLRKPVVSDS